MLNLYDDLLRLKAPIRVGVVGTGSIGRGIALQANITQGTTCVAIANRTLERAIRWAETLAVPFAVVETADEMSDAIRSGQLAVCADGELVASCEYVDVLIESTSAVYEGARHAMVALNHNKDVVMMNHEADLMYGSYLLSIARNRGLIYTVSDGDQPAAMKRLADEVRIMGFELVMVGNIKGFLNRAADPTSIIPEAEKRNLNPRMCVSFTDGTKLNVEMAVVANGLDLVSTKPGMNGPRLNALHDILDVFDFDTYWDGSRGVVDYVIGPEPKGGVYAVGYTDVPHQLETLGWFPVNIGKGPFYLFYRPYHLGHFESMATVAEVVLHRRPVLTPEYGFRTNVFAHAKRPLRKGDQLDGIGGYACYGIIDNYSSATAVDGIPICLAERMTLRTDINAHEPIRFDQVEYDPTAPAIELYDRSLKEARIVRESFNDHDRIATKS